jgi:hypothetical protein
MVGVPYFSIYLMLSSCDYCLLCCLLETSLLVSD